MWIPADPTFFALEDSENGTLVFDFLQKLYYNQIMQSIDKDLWFLCKNKKVCISLSFKKPGTLNCWDYDSFKIRIGWRNKGKI